MDCPTHTHVKEIKCRSYNGRHEFVTDFKILADRLIVDGKVLRLPVKCQYCGATAIEIYEFREIIEGE